MVRDWCFFLTLGLREIAPLPTLCVTVSEHLTSTTRQEKEMQGIQIEKEKIKLSLLADDLNVYIENTKESIKKTCLF